MLRYFGWLAFVEKHKKKKGRYWLEDILEEKFKKKKRKILVGADHGTKFLSSDFFFGIYLLEGILDDYILWKSLRKRGSIIHREIFF